MAEIVDAPNPLGAGLGLQINPLLGPAWPGESPTPGNRATAGFAPGAKPAAGAALGGAAYGFGNNPLGLPGGGLGGAAGMAAARPKKTYPDEKPYAVVGIGLGVLALIMAFNPMFSGLFVLLAFTCSAAAFKQCRAGQSDKWVLTYIASGLSMAAFLAASFMIVKERNKQARDAQPPPPVESTQSGDSSDTGQATVADSSADNSQGTPTPARPQHGGEQWLDASQSVDVGSVQFQISEVVSGKVPVTGRVLGQEVTDETMVEYLLIRFTLTNNSQRTVSVFSPSSFARSTVANFALNDSRGHAYNTVVFNDATVAGLSPSTLLRPGEASTDAFIFEKPHDGIEYLRLQFYASSLGHQDRQSVVQVQIPDGMIQRR